MRCQQEHKVTQQEAQQHTAHGAMQDTLASIISNRANNSKTSRKMF